MIVSPTHPISANRSYVPELCMFKKQKEMHIMFCQSRPIIQKIKLGIFPEPCEEKLADLVKRTSSPSTADSDSSKDKTFSFILDDEPRDKKLSQAENEISLIGEHAQEILSSSPKLLEISKQFSQGLYLSMSTIRNHWSLFKNFEKHLLISSIVQSELEKAGLSEKEGFSFIKQQGLIAGKKLKSLKKTKCFTTFKLIRKKCL